MSKQLKLIMKTKLQFAFWGAATAISLAAFTAPVVAQQAANTSNPNSLGQVAKANDVYGNEVISSDNQKVGKLNNLVVDLESGRILYGVVNASKGRVGVAPEIFTSTPTGNDKQLHANVDKAKIDGAPQFSSNDKPGETGQASFIAQVYQYFGQSPWWQGATPANEGSFHNVHKASEVIGTKVEDTSNQTIGKINNLMLDLPAGRVAFVIFSPDSSLNLGDNLYALPPQAVTLSANGKNLVTGLDRSKLASAPHFASNSWPNLSDPTFAGQVYQYYGKQAWFQSGSSTTPQPTGR
jgi:sporulation protein YlmC with PRC-barrel domain